MSEWRALLRRTPLAAELEEAHRRGVAAATAGLQDAALGPARLTGTAVPLLADAAVTSAAPFVRAPLLMRMSRVRLLHPITSDGRPCPSCGVPVPCPTRQEID